MDNITFVLLFDENSTAQDPLRRTITDRAEQFQLQCVRDVATARARIGGGGVDIILMSLPPDDSKAEPLENFRRLHAEAPSIPIVVVCKSKNEHFAERAMELGAVDYLIREAYERDLLGILKFCRENQPATGNCIRPTRYRKTQPGDCVYGRERGNRHHHSRFQCSFATGGEA